MTQFAVREVKQHLQEIINFKREYLIPRYQEHVKKAIRKKSENFLKKYQHMDDNHREAVLAREIVRVKIIVAQLYVYLMPAVEFFERLYLLREFLKLVETATITDGVPEFDNSVYTIAPQLKHIVPTLTQDGYIRAINASDPIFQYRLTQKGQTLLEILQDVMPGILTEDHQKIAEKVVSNEMLGNLRRLIASMDESLLRAEIEQQCDKLEKWINDNTEDNFGELPTF